MSRIMASLGWVTLATLLVAMPALAQEPASPESPAAQDAAVEEAATPEAGQPKADTGEASATPGHMSQQLEDIASQVDQNEAAQETTAGILTPIYQVAEALEFPAFHWIAFAVMLAGVIGFAMQLVIGKLVVVAHMGFSVREILSDVLSFAISLIGLVLTTQAAAQNSTFTQSPFAVLSSSLVGLVLGVMLYYWGQSQEVDAVRGRRALAAEQTARGKK